MRTLLYSLLLLLPQTVLGAAARELTWVGVEATPANPDADVLVWTAWSGPSLEWLESQLDTFGNAGGLTIAIDSGFTLGELRKETVLAPEGTRVADVLVGVPHDQLAELVEDGLLADVSAYATAEYLLDLPEQASLAFVHEEQLLGLPLTLEGPALLVNTQLVPQLPDSYSQFISSAQTLERRPGSYGFRFDFSNFYFAWAWLGSYGATLFGPDGSPGLTGPEAVAGARMLQNLRFQQTLIPEGSDYLQAHELFASGRLGYMYDGPWAVSSYFAAGVPLTVMPVPPVSDGQPLAGFMSVQGVLVTSGSRARTSAANTAKWLVRSAAQLQLARQAGRIPASVQAVEALADDQILHGFGLALRHAQAVPTNELMPRVWPALGRFLEQLGAAPLSDGQIAGLLEQARDHIRTR